MAGVGVLVFPYYVSIALKNNHAGTQPSSDICLVCVLCGLGRVPKCSLKNQSRHTLDSDKVATHIVEVHLIKMTGKRTRTTKKQSRHDQSQASVKRSFNQANAKENDNPWR